MEFLRENVDEILDRLDAALMITDCEAHLLYGNKRFRMMEQAVENNRIAIAQAIRQVGSTGAVVTANAGHLLVTSSPVGTTSGAGPLVLTEISDVAGILSLKQQLEQSEKQRADYGQKLSRISFKNCIANSASMISVFEKAKQVACFPTTVFLIGETGVGKEVVTSFIHLNSDRADKPLIKVNCSAIPDQLLESELFGYESGAFIGASTKGKAGLFELANGGTILLDEIGDMNLALQTKLLRVLQENEIMRLGGQKTVPLDVRVISSTNRDIKSMVEQGQFSDALYYRLNVVELHIPPLRERREDIIPLAGFFMQHFCEKYKLQKNFSLSIRECFLRYEWPGNVRELRNIVENLVVSSLGEEIELGELPARMRMAHPRIQPPIPDQTLKSAVEDVQRRMIERALREEGSLRKAARRLDVDPSTLHRLTKKLELELNPQ